jgi:hypothetical protein
MIEFEVSSVARSCDAGKLGEDASYERTTAATIPKLWVFVARMRSFSFVGRIRPAKLNKT